MTPPRRPAASDRVTPPRPQPPDLSEEMDPTVTAEQLAGIERDHRGRIASVRVQGGTELPGLRDQGLIDVHLEGVFSASWDAAGAELERCVLSGLRLGALEMPEARWDSVTVSDGRWGYANLRGSELRDVVIEGVTVEDLDLGDAQVQQVAVRDCHVGTLHLRGARCEDVDLRGSTIDRVEGLDGARGCVVDPQQALLWAERLAQHLGIRVLGEQG